MTKTLGALALLLAYGTAHSQSADISVASIASPSADLIVGQEIVVTTTAINAGPSAAQNVLVLWGAPIFQPFVLEDPQSVTPGCVLEFFDIDPPTFNFGFRIPLLPAGEQRTCAVRVRVRVVPTDYQLLVGADAFSGQTPDPVLTNNTVQYQLTFATPPPRVIPAVSAWGLIVMAAGALCLGRCCVDGGQGSRA